MMIRDRLLSLSVTLLLITTGMMVIISIPEEFSPVHLMGTSNASFAGGDGTVGDPYQISDVDQLQEMEADLEAHYLVINDIDASDTSNWNSGEGFDPIGNSSAPFSGSLDGGSYNISNLCINAPLKDHRGIFGVISDGSTLSNIRSINTDFTGHNYVGGLVGRKEGGNVHNCTISGDIHGNNKVGGLIGYNFGGVENCHSTCNVNATNDVGGLIGDNNGGNISYCSASGDIYGDQNFIGGLIGWNDLRGNITFCYAAGDTGGNLSGCSRGGLLGYNDGGTIFCSFATGNASGDYDIGGLVGHHETGGSIENCYALGDVVGFFTAGGLVGTNKESISNCYSTGMVDPGDRGGLAGYGSGRVYNSFWDIEASQDNRSYGGTGLNTTEMKTGSIFRYAGWNMIDIWGIIEGRSYPYLRWHDYPGVPGIVTEDDIDAVEDSPYQIEYYANSSLPGGGGAFWSMRTDATNWLTLDPSGLLHGTPSNEFVGSYWVNITARLFEDGFDFHNFTISVDNVNDPPAILMVVLPDAREDDPYQYDLYGWDVDPTNDIVSWTMATNSGFLTINEITGQLTGDPTNDDVGVWWVHVNISDGNGGYDEANLFLFVLNVNDEPRILPFEVPVAYEDVPFWLDLEAEDVDPTGDHMSWSLMTNSSFLILDPETGTISGLPRNEDVGIWSATVEVHDGKGGSDLTVFSFEVVNINDDPVIATESLPDGLEDELYSFTLQGYDVDPTLDPLLFQIMETNTDFLNIDPVENILSGIPENDDVGTWWVNLTLLDGNGGYDWKNYTLTIVEVNDPPTLNVTELVITIEEDTIGFVIDLSKYIFDEDGDRLSFDVYIDQIYGSIIGYELTIYLVENWSGQTSIWLSASDRITTSYLNGTVIVTPINDAPTGVVITAEPSYYVGGEQLVHGDAFDADIPYGDELIFIWSSNISGEVGTGTMIQMSLPVGHHLITLTVVDMEGLSTTATVEIEIIAEDVEEVPEVKDDNEKKFLVILLVIITITIILFGIVIYMMMKGKKDQDRYEE